MSALARDTSEIALMRMIRDQMSVYIRAGIISAKLAGPVQQAESFMAALTANESGGNPNAQRYEPYEMGKFAELLGGAIDGYQGISAEMLLAKVNGIFNVGGAVRMLMQYATSWGPTQMMGWHALKDGYDIGQLIAIGPHYLHAAREIGRFCAQFHIDLADTTKKWENCAMLFHCWNAGAPNRPTTDDGYTERGIARTKIYEGLQQP